jgi:hypothetical protein
MSTTSGNPRICAEARSRAALSRRHTLTLAAGLLLAALAVAVPLTRSASATARHRGRSANPPCLNARQRGLRELQPAIAHVRNSAPGKVLPGRTLRSQLPRTPGYVNPNPLFPHYPDGKLPAGPLSWRNTSGVPASHLLYARNADAIFNAEHDRYRIAFNQSYFGVVPTNIGDFGGTGVTDLAIPDHYAYVDGGYEAGEVDIYYGRHGHHIDPRRDIPDVIFYGDESQRDWFDGGKLGISIARAGDVNGDGHDDLLIAAGFHAVPAGHGRQIYLAGKIYLIYGGYLSKFRCPVKIRASEIGRRIPGIVFYGGLDGGLYTGWANELDAGNFSGTRLNDFIIGSYDPYPTGHAFAARAYLIYGSRKLPKRMVGYRLGVDLNRDGIRSTVYTLPDVSLTQSSLGFSASFAGDLTGSGHDDLAFSAGQAGPTRRGEDFIFFEPPPRGTRTVPIESAPLTIYADQMSSPSLQFAGLGTVRPNGDVFGDGHQDALLTARYTRGPGGSLVGAVGVLEGGPHLPAQIGFSQLRTIMYGTQPGTIGQPSMAHAADFDGDGCTDIVINDAYYLENVGGSIQDRGRLWLIRGRSDLPHLLPLEQGADRTFLANLRYPGLFGFNWDTGDWNADGRPDIVIADHYSGDRQLHDLAGRTYLFYNKSLHLPWGKQPDCAARR